VCVWNHRGSLRSALRLPGGIVYGQAEGIRRQSSYVGHARGGDRNLRKAPRRYALINNYNNKLVITQVAWNFS
jgi:hypothetical protein